MRALTATDPRAVGGYLLLARLGSGGMSTVYLARSGGGRLVALKTPHHELVAEPAIRERFRREAEATRVAGAFGAAVVDVGEEAVPWLATTYLAGISLQEAVAGHGPLPVPTVWALAAGLADALAVIHRAGVVHRDLTPANVMLLADGPRLIDFGIAAAPGDSAVTRLGVAGSPAYASPEQIRGDRVGPASDVFSLGGVLTYAATGKPPFGDVPVHTQLYRIVRDEPDLTAVADPQLREFLLLCLRKDPAQRQLRQMRAQADWLPPAVLVDIVERGRAAENAALPARFRPYVSADATAYGRRVSRRTILAASLGVAGLAAVGAGAALTASAVNSYRYPWTFAKHGDTRLAAGKVWIAVASDDLYVLDARSGEVTWHRPVREATVDFTLTVVKSNACVSDGSRMSVYDVNTGDSIFGVDGAAAAAGDTIFYQADDGFDAVDIRSGAQRWHHPNLSGLDPPTLCGDVVAAVEHSTGLVHGLNARTGAEIWTYATGRRVGFEARLVADRSRFYFGSGGNFVALDALTGEPSWKVTGPAVPPVLIGDTVYIGAQGGTLHAYDAASGRQKWAFPVGADDDEFGHGTHPSVAGDMVFFYGSAQRAFAADAATGKKVWERMADSPNVPGGSPAVRNGVVYLIGSDALTAVEARTGKEIATRGLADYGEATIAGDGLIYVQTASNVTAVRTIR